jgi:hypothetical protein
MTTQELLDEVKPRYLKAPKKEKGQILDEFCLNTGYARKYAINILQAGYDYHRVKREGHKKRKKIYGEATLVAVITIWEFLEYPCGLRLKPVLAGTAEALERFNEIQLNESIKNDLQKISARTLDRRLKKERQIRRLHRNRGATKHGSLLKSSIPIRITNWDIREVGFMEMDTVAHNGGDSSGEHVWSLDVVEIYSGWSEQLAVLGKSEFGIVKAINEVKDTVPFDVLGFDSDGGSEFINWHMVRYCKRNDLMFTRSRPDRKNDNAYVEQKNYTHIRQWLGYGRYDTMEQLMFINDLYRNELRLFNNFFRPVMKIKSKEKINNSVCRKRYDTAKTPYQRLMESSQIRETKGKELQAMYLSLNPAELKRRIDQKIKKIKQMGK